MIVDEIDIMQWSCKWKLIILLLCTLDELESRESLRW